jgi:hypothetical protein
LHRLGTIRDRSATDRHDQIRPGFARHRGGGDHGGARRMRRHLVEHARATIAQGGADFGDHVGFAVERAADHQEHALGAQAPGLLGDRFGGGFAEHDLIHFAEYDASFAGHGRSSLCFAPGWIKLFTRISQSEGIPGDLSRSQFRAGPRYRQHRASADQPGSAPG